jgi:hypothetical protein
MRHPRARHVAAARRQRQKPWGPAARRRRAERIAEKELRAAIARSQSYTRVADAFRDLNRKGQR